MARDIKALFGFLNESLGGRLLSKFQIKVQMTDLAAICMAFCGGLHCLLNVVLHNAIVQSPSKKKVHKCQQF